MFRRGELGRTIGMPSALVAAAIGGAILEKGVSDGNPAPAAQAGQFSGSWTQYPQLGRLRTAACLDDAKPVLPKGTELCVGDNIYGTGLFSDDPEGRFLQSLVVVHDPNSGVRNTDTGHVDPSTEDTCYQTVPGVAEQWRICERLDSNGSYHFVAAKPEPLDMPN